MRAPMGWAVLRSMGVASTGASSPVGMEPGRVGVYREALSLIYCPSTLPLWWPDRLK